MQKLDHAQCPECGSSHIIYDEETGEHVCGECGLVIREDMLDRGPEWRALTLEEKAKKRRTGGPTEYSRYDKGLSTMIRIDRDAFGRPLSAETKRQMWRLRKWHVRSRMHASRSRNLIHAMNELERLSDKLHIPSSVKEMAAVVYRKALDRDLVRGRSITGIVAAALYAAIRFTKKPKTLKEIAEASTRDEKEIARDYRMLLQLLDIRMPIDDPVDYVSKIAEKAKISGETLGLAVRIIRDAQQKRVTTGKDPTGLAAAALYIACQMRSEKITQKEIAQAAGVTEVTIRNRKRELDRELNLKSLVTIPSSHFMGGDTGF